MTLSLADLVTPLTEDDVEGQILGLLASAGFPTNSWDPKSVPRRLVKVFSRGLADLSTTIANIAQGGIVTLATGAWLSLVGESFYDTTRNGAIFTVGTIRLTDAGAIGPESFAVGQLWAISATGQLYRNTSAGTLPLSGTLDLTFQAESPGVSYNVSVGAITELQTPLPGITVSNPAIGITGTWITVRGADEESDADYLVRLKDKWATLGKGANEDAYTYWSRTASSEVSRVKVAEATPVAGDVTVYLASTTGVVSGAAVTAVSDYFASTSGHVMSVLVHASSAGAHPITITGTVSVTTAYRTSAIAGWAASLIDYSTTLPIGGTVRVAEIIQRIMDQAGVVDVHLVSPGANVVLATSEVAVFTDSLTWANV